MTTEVAPMVTERERIERYLSIKRRPVPEPIKTFAVHGVEQERALRGPTDEECWKEADRWVEVESRRRVAFAETQEKRRLDYASSQRCPACGESGVDSHDYPRRRDIGLGRQVRLCLRCATVASTVVARRNEERLGKVASYLSHLDERKGRSS